MANKDSIAFTLTWTPTTTRAELHYIIDNDRVIEDAKGKTGDGKISLTYTTDEAPTHRIEWSLWFPNKTLKQLEAKAKVNADEESPLNKAKDADSKWEESGLA
jgi:hypothetical protein